MPMTPTYALSDCYFGSDLFRQLAKAEQELKEIRAENERLMAELNALRKAFPPVPILIQRS